MVLASRTVPSVPEVESESVGDKLSSFSPPPPVRREQLLDTCAQNTYVGMLSQLSVLAHYSGEIFGGLLKESNDLFGRLQVLNKRIEYVTQNLPALDKFFNPNSFDIILQNPRAEFSNAAIQKAGIFTQETLPPALLNTYKNCYPPPQLSKMDQFMEDGKKCMELYTNPQFFFNEWIEEQKKQRLVARDQRAKRREVRKAQKDKEEVKQQNAPKHVAALERIMFDPNTGQKIVVKTTPTERPLPAARPTPATPAASKDGNQQPRQSFPTNNPPAYVSQKEAFIPPPPPSDNFSNSAAPPPPPPEDFESYDSMQEAPAAPVAYAPPPPSHSPVAAREIQRGPSGMAPPPPPRDEYVPPPTTPDARSKMSQRELPSFVPVPPPTAPITPQPISPVRSAEGAPSAPSSAPMPPPPPPPMEGGLIAGPTTGGLAAAMLNVQLKKSEPSAGARKPDARGGLLEGIRGGISLKTVHKEDAATKKKEDAPNSVAAILARRIAIVGDSDDESSDEEGDEEWD